jgi:hypothetical protein
MPNEPSRELRTSHEDRDKTVEQLRVAAGDGRLNPDELDQRVEAALNARTYRELAVLVADLPAARAVTRPGFAAAPPKNFQRIELSHSNARRDGRWAVPNQMLIMVREGNVVLDFTEADITWPTLLLSVFLHDCNLTLITKPGMLVDADELSLDNSKTRIRRPPGPEVPAVLRIELTGSVDHSKVVARSARLPFWH